MGQFIEYFTCGIVLVNFGAVHVFLPVDEQKMNQFILRTY